MPEKASAVSRRVLLGMVPVLMAAPPTAGFRSTTATFLPSRAAVLAAAHPAGPAPITTTSNSWTVGGMGRTPGRGVRHDTPPQGRNHGRFTGRGGGATPLSRSAFAFRMVVRYCWA